MNIRLSYIVENIMSKTESSSLSPQKKKRNSRAMYKQNLHMNNSLSNGQSTIVIRIIIIIVVAYGIYVLRTRRISQFGVYDLTTI